MISVSYFIDNDTVKLADDFRLTYDFDPSKYAKELGYKDIAISSIEYNKYTNSLFLLTSYESAIDGEITDESVGAFLWELSLEKLWNNQDPGLLINIHFAHKAEGITIINKNKMMVIHDDDRVLGRENITNPDTQFFRQHNQNAYTILER